jgi:hypothetical protein
MSKVTPVSSKSIRKHILSLVSIVHENLKRRLSDKFILIFDEWTEGTDHYIGIWASYNTSVLDKSEVDNGSKETPVQSLLSIRPLLEGGIQGMTTQDHLTHIIICVLQHYYGKTTSNVMCLVGDNCGVNRSIARTMSIPLIGCGSHKFNLAVQRWMKEQPQLIAIVAKVAAIMKKASTLKVAAKLKELTRNACVKSNETRWLSMYNMVGRYF